MDIPRPHLQILVFWSLPRALDVGQYILLFKNIHILLLIYKSIDMSFPIEIPYYFLMITKFRLNSNFIKKLRAFTVLLTTLS